MGPYFKAGSKSQLHLIIQIIKVLRKSEGTERKKARLDRLGRSEKKWMWGIFKPASQTESRGWRVRPSSIQKRSFGLKMWVVFLTDVWRNTRGCVDFQSVFFTFMYFSVLSRVCHWRTVIGPLMMPWNRQIRRDISVRKKKSAARLKFEENRQIRSTTVYIWDGSYLATSREDSFAVTVLFRPWDQQAHWEESVSILARGWCARLRISAQTCLFRCLPPSRLPPP